MTEVVIRHSSVSPAGCCQHLPLAGKCFLLPGSSFFVQWFLAAFPIFRANVGKLTSSNLYFYRAFFYAIPVFGQLKAMVVTRLWDQGSGITVVGSGIKMVGSGITVPLDQGLQVTGSASAVFLRDKRSDILYHSIFFGLGIKICHAFGFRITNLGAKMRSAMNTYLITILELGFLIELRSASLKKNEILLGASFE